MEASERPAHEGVSQGIQGKDREVTTLNRTFILSGERPAQSLWAFLKANWRAMADAGKALAVTVTEHQSKRSVEQNRRYWALLNDVSANAWVQGKQYSSDAWHELFKRQFIGMDELPNGELAGISTTKLNVGEFGDYMTKVECYAVEQLGVTFQ